jgi:lipopolysaccharide transport system ATP-binding protein
MSGSKALAVSDLGKRYRIGVERHGTFRDALAHPLRRLNTRVRAGSGEASHVWALRDVSFEVSEGEAVGIIGRNGAGKSTLLKILARITRPTTGRASLSGAVGSLLEVGTGFHPELTGRENVYLNGAILGMTKGYIDRRFDEIVAFAETDRFVDTPVKRYSSGMQMRLAFAVAAHLEPEILLVDEVLAVGDAQFQRKCLGKMSEVAEEGRTILFVSHNMGSIVRLCDRAVWIEGGRLQRDGGARDVVRSYLTVGEAEQTAQTWGPGEGPGDDSLRLASVRITQEGQPTTNVHIDKPFDVEVETEVNAESSGGVAIAIRVLNPEGDILLESSEVMQDDLPVRRRGRWVTRCSFPAYALNGGSYYLSVFADEPHVRIVFSEESVLKWTIEAVSAGMGRYAPGAWKGVLGPGLPQWSLHGVD